MRSSLIRLPRTRQRSCDLGVHACDLRRGRGRRRDCRAPTVTRRTAPARVARPRRSRVTPTSNVPAAPKAWRDGAARWPSRRRRRPSAASPGPSGRSPPPTSRRARRPRGRGHLTAVEDGDGRVEARALDPEWCAARGASGPAAVGVALVVGAELTGVKAARPGGALGRGRTYRGLERRGRTGRGVDGGVNPGPDGDGRAVAADRDGGFAAAAGAKGETAKLVNSPAPAGQLRLPRGRRRRHPVPRSRPRRGRWPGRPIVAADRSRTATRPAPARLHVRPGASVLGSWVHEDDGAARRRRSPRPARSP